MIDMALMKTKGNLMNRFKQKIKMYFFADEIKRIERIENDLREWSLETLSLERKRKRVRLQINNIERQISDIITSENVRHFLPSELRKRVNEVVGIELGAIKARLEKLEA